MPPVAPGDLAIAQVIGAGGAASAQWVVRTAGCEARNAATFGVLSSMRERTAPVWPICAARRARSRG
jgi:hypothetical protein